jgi:hypothetical protein
MYLISSLHVSDSEGTRVLRVTEYGVATLVDGEVMGTCRGEYPGKFDEYLGIFIKLRNSGSFGRHNASVEAGLLRHYPASLGFVKRCLDSSELGTARGRG